MSKEGLLNYFSIGAEKKYGIFDAVDANYKEPFAPEPEDLYRLHRLIRSRKAFNVLEFGLGYSTIVAADALAKNMDDFNAAQGKPDVRIKNPFRIYCVDASSYWIDAFKKMYENKFPYLNRIDITLSKCRIGEFCGQICHFYDHIPNVVADFIYLDAPSANDVEGSVNNITFKDCPERTVMSGDLLKLEPTLLPGTMILVDGRTSNARFLKNNFKRSYFYEFSEKADVSIFELLEQPLGKINRNQISYSLGKEYFERLNML